MSKEKIKFQNYALATTFDHEIHGEIDGVFIPFDEAEKLDGVLCKIETVHWTWWEIIRGRWNAKKLSKILKVTDTK